MSTPQDWDDEERAALEGLDQQIETIRRRYEKDPPVQLLTGDLEDPGIPLTREDEDRLLSRILNDAAPVTGPVPLATGKTAGAGGASGARKAGVTSSASRVKYTLLGLAVAASMLIVLWQARRPVPVDDRAPAESLKTASAEPGRTPEGDLPSVTRPVTPELPPSNAPAPAGDAARDAALPPPASRTRPSAVLALAFDKPAVRLSTAALVWRGGPRGSSGSSASSGSSSDANPFTTDLTPAITAYRRGDHADAARGFEALRAKYPSAVEVLFYLGASRMLIGEFDRAIEPLAEAAKVADSTFAAESAWLLAVAEQRSGRRTEARTRLRELCDGRSPFKTRACDAVTALDRDASGPR